MEIKPHSRSYTAAAEGNVNPDYVNPDYGVY